MKDKLRIFIFSLSALLSISSCAASSSSALDSIYRSYDEPQGGTYNPLREFKEREAFDVSTIEDAPDIYNLQPTDLRNQGNRKDGSLFPFEHKTPANVQAMCLRGDPSYIETISRPEQLFDPEAYVYLQWTPWYIDIHDDQPEESTFVEFFLSGDVILNPAFPFIDGVYSHGEWSFVANYACVERELREKAILEDPWAILRDRHNWRFFWFARHCSMQDYPYTVYFDRGCFYFMRKSSAFPNDYIEEFNKREDMHLLLP